ncbi:hypothetical protein M1349_00700 [Patescibacteria group bacterium]|nr:hypothetical protein [Patescibacteria group bacterium]
MQSFVFFSNVRTKADLSLAKEEIEVIKQEIYKKDCKESLKKLIRASTYALLGKVKFDKSKVKAIVEQFEKEISDFKVLTLTIAFEPTESLITKVNRWVKENLGEKIVVDFKKNAEIVAGAEVVFGGIYKDYALTQILKDKLVSDREVIMSKLVTNN